MAVVYAYKIPGKYKVPANIVGEICAELENMESGLTPESLLEHAKSESSPIHSMFEWDDTIAADKWRKDQARRIIKDIVVTKVPAKEPVRAYVNVKKSVGEHQYKSIDAVVNRPDWKSEMLMSARIEMENFIRKYGVLSSMDDRINDVIVYLNEYIELLKKSA